MVGSWFVAGDIRLDLAALNKVETLLWDIWGTGASSEDEMTDGIRALYDEAAAVTAGPEPDFAAVRDLFTTNDGLRTPRTVLSLAPCAARPGSPCAEPARGGDAGDPQPHHRTPAQPGRTAPANGISLIGATRTVEPGCGAWIICPPPM